MAAVTGVAPPAPAEEWPFDITSEMFFGMIEAGLFPPHRRVYLRDGRLYEKRARAVAHAATAAAFCGALARRLPPDWCLWPENPLAVDPKNAPLPDMTVVRGRPFDYRDADRHPEPRDVGLRLEIAASGPPEDPGRNRELYARASVPVYWVADVLGRRVLAHAEPRVVEGRGEYARVETYGPGGALPLVLDGREVALIPYGERMR